VIDVPPLDTLNPAIDTGRPARLYTVKIPVSTPTIVPELTVPETDEPELIVNLSHVVMSISGRLLESFRVLTPFLPRYWIRLSAPSENRQPIERILALAAGEVVAII
jgi:hypothetical protein